MPKSLDKQIKKYIKSLDSNSLKAYQIAKIQLKSSFNIEKSIGFKKWRENHNKNL